MKKIVLVLLILLVAAGSAFAFNPLSYPPPLEGGGKVLIDFGIGLETMRYTGYKWLIPPIFFQVEYALPVKVPISVGGGISTYLIQYKWHSSPYNRDITERGFDIVPQVRANWHWAFNVNWLDFYTGFSLGYEIFTYTHNYTISGYKYKSTSGKFHWGFQAGAHFYFSKNFGAIVETGYPYWIKAGLSLKFP